MGFELIRAILDIDMILLEGDDKVGAHEVLDPDDRVRGGFALEDLDSKRIRILEGPGATTRRGAFEQGRRLCRVWLPVAD